MKGKKFLSCLLTVALCLSAVAIPAAAASFPDIVDHWGASYIEDAVEKGIFIGIKNESTGVMEFMPNQTVTASEVLVTCARMAVDSETRADIAADRAEQVEGLITNNGLSWFRPYAAVCLEAGILSYAELKELFQSGELTGKPITKERFSLYLVRAMQLEGMAQGLPDSYNLDFTDTKDITPGLEPYIYVLNMYSVVGGTDTGAFQPKSGMNRAVAAKMLSVATDVIEENGITTELSEYTDYDWVSGNVISANAGDKGVIILTLNSELSGVKTISLPADVPVYQNNMLAKSTALKPGLYARVNLNGAGEPLAVRLGGSVSVHTGSVVAINGDTVMLNQSGGTVNLSYDRFTEVQVGGKTDDRALIDPDAGYTAATCYIDQLGKMVALKLVGGTHKEEGLVSKVESVAGGGLKLEVSGFDGQLQRYTVPESAALTANGMALSMESLNSSYKGSYVSLRVSNENASNANAVAVDTVTKYIQGAVKAATVETGVNTVTVTDLATNKATTYKVADKATFAYEDAAITYGGVQRDWFVTVRIAGGELAGLWGYPGASVTEGEAAISYPSGSAQIVLSVTRAGGSVVTFPFNLEDDDALPTVTREGKRSSLAQLRGGDVVKVTVRYNTVISIEATAQSANVTGTITKVEQTTSGVTVTVKLDGSDEVKTFRIGTDTSVTRNNVTISMYDLRVDHHVAMVVGGDQVSRIDVDKTTASTGQITGTVFLPYDSKVGRSILFRANDGGSVDKPPITVLIPNGVTIQEATGGSLSISNLKTGDVLDIYGAYVENQFKATLVIRK